MATQKALSTEELHELAMRIADNPDEVCKLGEDDLAALRRHISPASGFVASKPCFANMSITNWKDRAMRRMIMTAMIGYLYRVLDEYEPTSEIERETARHKAALSKLAPADTAARKQLEADHERAVALLTSTARGIARKFLDRHLSFNPDLHVRGAHTKTPGERKTKTDGIRAARDQVLAAEAADAKLAGNPERAFQFVRNHLLTTYQEVSNSADTIAQAVKTLSSLPEPALSATLDERTILTRKWNLLNQHLEKMRPLCEPIAAAETLRAWEVEPPVNVFHQFDRYYTNHYDQLRDLVSTLYDESFDIEFSVTLYDAFKTAEGARDHLLKHVNEFRNDVHTIGNNGITLLGPFKENREHVDYYNKNTEILRRMHDQLESDHKLGADLMKKQVDTKKKKNIAEAGPDAPGLAAYSKSMNVVAELGAKKALSQEEADAYAAALKNAREIKDDYETPDDAIQIDMFYPTVDDSGKTVLGKKKFYSQAEQPTFMQDECRAEEYQPVRDVDESIEDAYVSRVIVSKTGEKKVVKCAKKSLM